MKFHVTGLPSPSSLVAAAAAHDPTSCPHRVASGAPTILVVGGMDALPPSRIAANFVSACAAAGLPDHRVLAATLLRSPKDAKRLPFQLALNVDVPAPRRGEPLPRAEVWPPQSSFDRRCSALMTRAMAWADHASSFDARGCGTNRVGRWMASPIALPLRYLYQEEHAALEHERFMQLIEDENIALIVGASFGGSVIIDNLLRAHHTRRLDGTRHFRVLTLGTNLGSILSRSSLYRGLQDGRGRLVCPTNIAWRHFYSPSDVFVAASALPTRFVGVECVEVYTGPLLGWPLTKPHAMGRYLQTPEVQKALREALSAGRTRQKVMSVT